MTPSGVENTSRQHTKSFGTAHGTKLTSLGLDGTIISDYVGRASES